MDLPNNQVDTAAEDAARLAGELILLKEIPILDKVLEAHTVELGGDFTAYRNHTYRVVNLCVALSAGDLAQLEKIATAAAFHDLGIWTDRTFDYLRPSVRLACAHLISTGRGEWASEITEMILEHHKISPYRGRRHRLVELLRRADWVDVSKGLITFGLPRKLLKEIFSTWPSAGFHKRLVRLELDRLRTHPWNPLPMVRL
jgi:HD domain